MRMKFLLAGSAVALGAGTFLHDAGRGTRRLPARARTGRHRRRHRDRFWSLRLRSICGLQPVNSTAIGQNAQAIGTYTVALARVRGRFRMAVISPSR